jgi:hypothetical protein
MLIAKGASNTSKGLQNSCGSDESNISSLDSMYLDVYAEYVRDKTQPLAALSSLR